MSTVYEHTRPMRGAEAIEEMVLRIHDRFDQMRRGRTDSTAVIRVAVPLQSLDLLLWLAQQQTTRRVFWSGRDGIFDMVGIGAADIVAGESPNDPAGWIDYMHTRLSDSSREARYYGGLRFDPDRPTADHWRPLGAYRFVLPRFEVYRQESKTALVCNLLPDDLDRAVAIVAQLRALEFRPQEMTIDLPRLFTRNDAPDREGWIASVEAAIESFRTGQLDKVVLARESRFEFTNDLDLVQLMTLLRAHTRGCFHFLFQFDAGGAFLGATPERLYARHEHRLRSEALAGTRPRGADDDEDQRLGEKLLASQKEAREHKFVADSTRRILTSLCQDLRGGEERSLVKLARVQHMITRFEGDLRKGIGDAEILTALHPTPAVGGVPTDTARKRIRELEPFDRGWYAGPVGWIGPSGAEFAVGIRSALVEKRQLRLYSGAGIVEGSHPDREWDEIENKIGSFLRILSE